MFKIGDVVITRRMGYGAIGRILAIFDGYYFYQLHKTCNYTIWDQVYPEWREGMVVCLRLNTPQFLLTKEEFEKLCPEGNWKSQQKVDYISLPAADVEIYKD